MINKSLSETMKSFLLLYSFFLIILIKANSASFPNYYPKFEQLPIEDDAGVPLILTPLIEQNKIEDARLAAAVHFNGFKNIESYAGYFTVNKKYNSNMYFWFFPSQTNWTTDPLLIWLQGGPGASSLIGLFAEHGPFKVMSQNGLELREYSWTKSHSVIYMDNPVGTGFSFTNEGGYVQNETQVGEDLYNALQQFFLLFPELQKNDFFVTGESYGGKYVPALGHTIHLKNPEAKIKINLKGLAMGNGFSDPINQLNYGDYLYQLGLIDSNTRDTFKLTESKGIDLIKNKEYAKAFEIFDELMDGDMTNDTLFKNATGFKNYYNYLYPVDPSNEEQYMAKYLQRADVRAAIHVGNATFDNGDEVEKNLKEDVFQSVAPWVSELLDNYRVLIYNGQLDIIVAYPLTINFLQNLNFSAANQYKTAQRHIWRVGSDIAGYVKEAGNLTEALVRNSGHMVPTDQPQWAFDLITRFTRNKPFY